MRIVWVTDIHLEFLDAVGVEAFLNLLRGQGADAILVGGDIGQSASVVAFLELIEQAVTAPVYFVLGNHDYYGGSIEETRLAVSAACNGAGGLCWLDEAGVISLTEKTALVGHGGWGDARLGNFETSPVQLNDWWQIDELGGLSRARRNYELQRLGDEAAEHFRRVVPEALGRHRDVVVLTHVPPWAESAWHAGTHSAPDWLPWFACAAVGEVLKSAMAKAPSQQMTVLCGHTHGSGTTRILPNLTVHTAGAEYGKPGIAQVFRCE